MSLVHNCTSIVFVHILLTFWNYLWEGGGQVRQSATIPFLIPFLFNLNRFVRLCCVSTRWYRCTFYYTLSTLWDTWERLSICPYPPLWIWGSKISKFIHSSILSVVSGFCKGDWWTSYSSPPSMPETNWFRCNTLLSKFINIIIIHFLYYFCWK